MSRLLLLQLLKSKIKKCVNKSSSFRTPSKYDASYFDGDGKGTYDPSYQRNPENYDVSQYNTDDGDGPVMTSARGCNRHIAQAEIRDALYLAY
jgi:hypothetical protein